MSLLVIAFLQVIYAGAGTQRCKPCLMRSVPAVFVSFFPHHAGVIFARIRTRGLVRAGQRPDSAEQGWR